MSFGLTCGAGTAAAWSLWKIGLWMSGPEQTDEDLTRMRYVVGTIGSGKTMYLTSLWRDSLRRGHTCIWVTTHGAGKLLAYTPPSVPVLMLDPVRGLGMNPLRRYSNTERERSLIASQVLTLLERLYPTSFGEAMLEVAHAATQAILELGERDEREVTMLDLYRLLKSGDIETEAAIVRNPIVADTLANADERSAKAVIRRIGRAMSNDILYRALTSKDSKALDMTSIVKPKEQLAVICNIDHNEIGRENASFLAQVVTSQLEVSLTTRKGTEPMVSVFLDEFQTYCHAGLAESIEEGRKRRYCLTLAHQSRGEQLASKRVLEAAELCGSQYFFTLRPSDARYAETVIESVPGAMDKYPKERFISLPPRRVIAREMVRGRYIVRTFTTPFLYPMRRVKEEPDRDIEVASLETVRTDGVVERRGA